MGFLDKNSGYSPLDDAIVTPPLAEADAFRASPGQRLSLNEDWELVDHFSRSSASLKDHGNDSLCNGETSESHYDRKNNIGMGADLPQCVHETTAPVLKSEFGNTRYRELVHSCCSLSPGFLTTK